MKKNQNKSMQISWKIDFICFRGASTSQLLYKNKFRVELRIQIDFQEYKYFRQKTNVFCLLFLHEKTCAFK